MNIYVWYVCWLSNQVMIRYYGFDLATNFKYNAGMGAPWAVIVLN